MANAAPGGRKVVYRVRADPLARTSVFLWTFRVCLYGLLGIGFWVGGPVIQIGVVAAAVLVPFADRSGAVGWLFRLIGLAAGVLLAPVVSLPLGMRLATPLGVSMPLALGLAVVAVAVVCGLVGGWIGRRLSRPAQHHRYLYVLNRAGGSVLGLGEAGLAAVVVCWLLSLFGPTIALYQTLLVQKRPNVARLLADLDGLRRRLLEDATGRRLHNANPLSKVPAVSAVVVAADLWAEPWLFWRAAEDGRLEELLAIPAVRRHYEAVKADPEMRRAVKQRDLQAVLYSRHYLAALDDEEFCREMAARWPELRSRISDEELRRARMAATRRLDKGAKARLDQAVKRAEQYDIRVP
jgi:hypothetical protein